MTIPPPIRRANGTQLLGTVFLIVALFIVAAPAIYAMITSLQPRSASLSPKPNLTFVPTLKNYAQLFGEYDFLHYFWNSFASSFGATIVGLAAGVPAAYALSRVEFRGKGGITLALLATRALPAIGVAVPYFVIFTGSGLIDRTWALIIVYSPFCIGLVTWLMHTYFDSVPASLDEASSLDGCTRLGTLWRIVIPLSTPGLAATGIFAFLFGWNNFLYPLVLTQTSAVTVPVALTQFIGEYTVNWGQIMAGITVLSAPLVVFSFVFKKYMVSGLSQGAIRE